MESEFTRRGVLVAAGAIAAAGAGCSRPTVPLSSAVRRIGDDYNLLVPAGQTVEVPAIDYVFDNVTIEEGGTLLVQPQAENWVLIQCRRDFILNGSIEFRRFVSDEEERQLQVGSQTYRHASRMDRLGGAGGASGFSRQGPWAGASGTPRFGGGGGAGGMGTRNGSYPGAAATGRVGPATNIPSKGGDGGQGALYGNGGLLFLDVGAFQFGPSNVIDLRGSDGAPGTAGSHGRNVTGGAIYGSGGGGGAPGGAGGVLYHRGRSYDGALLRVRVDGGNGGAAGAGGRAAQVNANTAGLPGAAGQDGRPGFSRLA